MCIYMSPLNPPNPPLTESLGVNHDTVVGIMKSLQASFFVESEQTENQEWEITEEGSGIMEQGR
jgi:hypothetical protein